eukprot:g161.t1
MKPKEDLVQKELENLKPLTQVCCGCSLSFGVALILLAYLARSIYASERQNGPAAPKTTRPVLQKGGQLRKKTFHIRLLPFGLRGFGPRNCGRLQMLGVCKVVFQEERFESSSSLELQTFHAFTALLGLPFIVSGFYALYAHCDSYLRPFMYFMIVSFVVGALEMVLPLWMNGACAFVPEGLKQTGAAGACGFLRVLFVVFFGQLAAIEAYFIFAVWSLCEDMKVNMRSSLPEMHKARGTRRRAALGPAEALFAGDGQPGHFEESLTCSAAGKLYVLQLKHLLMMLSAAQQEALTRAAQQERRFHWARASLMRAMNRRPARQLYAVGGRLAALGEELRALAQGGDPEVTRLLSACWSAESLERNPRNRPLHTTAAREKIPPLEPDLSRVPQEEVPKTRLHSSLLELWSSDVLADRQSQRSGQQIGVLHGFGPAVQANRFRTQFFKVPTGPWSHARLKASATEPALRKQKSMKALSGGDEEPEFFDFEDEGMSPILDAKIKDTGPAGQSTQEKAAFKIQAKARLFLRRMKSMHHAATCIQRAFRRKMESHELEEHEEPELEERREVEEDHNEQLADAGPQASEKGDVAAGGCKDAPDVSSPRVAPRGSIFQLDFDADTPKLSDLKKALSRASRISRRSTHVSKVEQELHEALESRSRSQSRELPELPRPMVVPVDLIEKHKLLMSMEVLDPWPPAAPGHSELQRVRRTGRDSAGVETVKVRKASIGSRVDPPRRSWLLWRLRQRTCDRCGCRCSPRPRRGLWSSRPGRATRGPRGRDPVGPGSQGF